MRWSSRTDLQSKLCAFLERGNIASILAEIDSRSQRKDAPPWICPHLQRAFQIVECLENFSGATAPQAVPAEFVGAGAAAPNTNIAPKLGTKYRSAETHN